MKGFGKKKEITCKVYPINTLVTEVSTLSAKSDRTEQSPFDQRNDEISDLV